MLWLFSSYRKLDSITISLNSISKFNYFTLSDLLFISSTVTTLNTLFHSDRSHRYLNSKQDIKGWIFEVQAKILKKSRLLKFCYVPASAWSSKGIFAVFTSSTSQRNKAGSMNHKSVYFLNVMSIGTKIPCQKMLYEHKCLRPRNSYGYYWQLTFFLSLGSSYLGYVIHLCKYNARESLLKWKAQYSWPPCTD